MRGDPATRELSIDEALKLAVGLQRQGHVDDAERIFQTILGSEPTCVDALHFLGVLQYQWGRAEDGVALVRRAIELSPTYADAYNNLGMMLRGMERFGEAVEAFEKAVEFGPGLAQAHLNLAGLLRRMPRRIGEAAAALRRAVELEPQLAEAHLHLGNVLYMMGQVKEAGEAFAAWAQIDPQNPVARHMAAACGVGPAPARASDAFVRQCFDTFAASFDERMETLNCQGPQLAAEAVAAAGYEPRAELDVLDAGCGTGLAGSLLRPYARRLDGVDLSSAMAEKARARGGYDELVVAELGEFLRSHPEGYDLIVAVDTLVYFGGLEDVLSATRTALRKGGRTIFTLEALPPAASGAGPGPGFVLNPHGRYSHGEAYVRRRLEDGGLTVEAVKWQPLRLEMGQPVLGMVVTARRSTPG